MSSKPSSELFEKIFICIRMIIVFHCSLYNLGKVRKRTAESCYFPETIFNCESFHGQSGNLACAGLVPVFFPLVNLLLNDISNEQGANTKFAAKPSVTLRH